MTLLQVLTAAELTDRDTVVCDWTSPQSLRVRGATGKTLHHAHAGGPWLIPGTWWSQEHGLTVFEAAEWPSTGAVARLAIGAQGATLTWAEAAKELVVTVPATVPVRAVQQSDFWYMRLPRIGGELPDFPLKQAFVHVFSDAAGSWSSTTWTAATTNGLTLSHTWDAGEIDDIGSSNALIAVWPPVNVPDWRLYSVLMQGLPVGEVERMQDGFFTATLSIGTTAAPSTFIDATQHEIRNVDGRPDVIGLVTEKGGPRVLFLRDRFGTCGGGIRLLTADDERVTGSTDVAIDFGTSHSAASWHTGTNVSSTVAATGERLGWNYPAIVRGAAGTAFDTPWLLGYPAPQFENQQQGEITYIPSGLFLRAITETPADAITDWSRRIPFVDYCLMGPAVNFEARAHIAMQRWRSGLKWSENDNASQAFLTAFLVWITAVRKGEGGTLRFSFPHAFSEPRREQFGHMLAQVASTVSGLTGSEFELASPCFPNNDATTRDRPFVDEATPVIFEVMNNAVTTFLHLNARNRQGVLVADLGGGTLDLLFAAVEVSNGQRDFRLIAAESVQFGAKAVIDLIQEKVTWRLPNADSVSPKLKNALLEQWTRSGELIQAILAGAKSESADKKFVRVADWRGNPRVDAHSIMEQVCIYFLFAREYCARFVGGVLTSPQLHERISTAAGSGGPMAPYTAVGPRAPGDGEIDWTGAPELDMAVALTGNGWRFLQLAGFDPLLKPAQIEDLFRHSVRERIATYSGLASIGEISLGGIGTPPKLMTAQGMVRLDPKIGEGGHTVEVAPNGCTDIVERVQKPWGTFVSPAEFHYDLPPQQIARVLDPPLAPYTDAWFTACRAVPSAARTYRGMTARPIDWNSITRRQAGGASTRQISTSRAMWETVVRSYLGLSTVG